MTQIRNPGPALPCCWMACHLEIQVSKKWLDILISYSWLSKQCQQHNNSDHLLLFLGQLDLLQTCSGIFLMDSNQKIRPYEHFHMILKRASKHNYWLSAAKTTSKIIFWALKWWVLLLSHRWRGWYHWQFHFGAFGAKFLFFKCKIDQILEAYGVFFF